MPTTENNKTMSLREAYAFAVSKGLSEEISEIKDMEIEWDRSYTSSVRRGFMIRLFQEKSLIEEFISSHWKNCTGVFRERKFKRLLGLAEEYENYIAGSTQDSEDEIIESSSSFEFALESHLRDFLARDLEHIEAGLKLYKTDERNGVEFPVDGGKIDILAIDKQGKFVVIELKLSQGRNKVLGQLLYYMGWVDANLSGTPCRGIVVASEISKELSTAVSRAPGVSLCRYKMSFSVESVQ